MGNCLILGNGYSSGQAKGNACSDSIIAAIAYASKVTNNRVPFCYANPKYFSYSSGVLTCKTAFSGHAEITTSGIVGYSYINNYFYKDSSAIWSRTNSVYTNRAYISVSGSVGDTFHFECHHERNTSSDTETGNVTLTLTNN